MKSKKMLEELKKQSEDLKKDLIDMEQIFTMKKEQYIRVQGAIDALTALEEPEETA